MVDEPCRPIGLAPSAQVAPPMDPWASLRARVHHHRGAGPRRAGTDTLEPTPARGNGPKQNMKNNEPTLLLTSVFVVGLPGWWPWSKPTGNVPQSFVRVGHGSRSGLSTVSKCDAAMATIHTVIDEDHDRIDRLHSALEAPNARYEVDANELRPRLQARESRPAELSAYIASPSITA